MILTISFDASRTTSKISTTEAMILRNIIDVDPEIRVLGQLLYPYESKLTKNLNGYWDHNAC